MSVRVIFGTHEDTGTPANSSGFNGFTFPFNYVVPNVEFPLGTTYQNVKKWWSRVRGWTPTTDLQASAGPYLITFPSTEQTLTDTDESTVRFLAVRDLIFSPDINTPASPPDETSGRTDLLFTRLADQQDAIRKDSGLFYLQLKISGSFRIVDNTGGNGVDAAWSTDAADLPGAPTGMITGTLDGVGVTVYYWSTVGGDGAFSITTLDFLPTLFWPYAAADASPIYNTTTGAQLQDPRN